MIGAASNHNETSMPAHAPRCTRLLRAFLLAATSVFTFAASAQTAPFPVDSCAAERIAQGLGQCTANDIRIASITITNGVTSCTAGQPVQLDLAVTIQVGAQARYDIGVFLATDGLPVDLRPSEGGSSSCEVRALPTGAPWANLNANVCGDVSAATGTQTLNVVGGSYLCASDGSGRLVLPGVVTWAQGAATTDCPASLPAGTLASQYVAPGGPSKCNFASTATIPPVDVLGSITVNKTVAGPDGTFSFTGTGFAASATGEPPFSIATAGGSGSHTISGLSTASAVYTITESVHPGYNLTNLSCSGGTVTTDLASRTATITLTSANPNVSCTFNNAATGSITVVKNALGGDDTFAFTGSAALGSAFNITTAGNTGSRSVTGLPAGSYTVTEGALPGGWMFNSLSCADSTGGSTFSTSGTTANINFAAGGTVTCTYTNTKLGSITINKSTQNGNGTFDFTGTGAGVAPFSITTVGFAGSHTISGLVPGGTYTVTEQAEAGWDLNAVSCSSGGSADLASRTITATNLAAGAAIACTFTNAQQADLSVTKTDGTVSVATGASTTYTVVVANAGPGPGNGAILTDPAVAGLTKTGTPTCVAGGGAVCPVSVTLAELESGLSLPTLPVGGFLTFTFTATVTAASGTVTNTATVTPAVGVADPNTGNNTASDTDVVGPAVDLEITKNDLRLTVTPGQTTTYTVIVNNLGPVAADGSEVSDPAAAGLMKTGTPTCTAAGGAVCPAVLTNALLEGSGVVIPTLPAGGSVTFMISAVVTAATGTVTNTAHVDAPAGLIDPNSGNDTASDTDTVITTADLTITKTDGTAQVDTGSTTTYTVVVTNQGPSAANGATLNDPAAAGLVKVGTPTCGSPTGGAACPASVSIAELEGAGVVIPVLPAGGSVTFTIAAQVTATSGTVTNTASVAPPAGTTDPAMANNTASDTDTVGLVADLAITKSSSPKPYMAGAALTYTVVVSNAGPSDAVGARVQDTLPAPVAAFTWTCTPVTAGASCATANGSGNIDALVTLPAGGSVTFTVTGTVPGGTAGVITNTATVTAPVGVTDPVPGNNSATDVNPTGPVADLSITKSSAPKPYVAGAPLTYTMVVTNSGSSNAIGARVQDVLPGPLSAFTWTCTAGGGGSACQTAAGVGNIDALVDLPVGTSVTFSVTGTVPGGTSGTLVNTGTVSAPTGITDPVPGNNTATDTNPTTTSADLAITKTSSPKPYTAGAALTYTIVATNNGPASAIDARVLDVVPGPLTGFGWTCTAGAGASCATAAGNGNIDALVTLPVGASVTFTLTGTVPPGTTGTIVNTSTISAPAGLTDPVPGNNSATDTNPTGPTVDLAITKGSAPKPYVPGSGLTYTMVVSNAGPASAPGSRVTDTLPGPVAGFTWTCAPSGGGGTCATAAGTGSIDVLVDLPAGGSVTFSVTGTVPPGTSGVLVNTASVAAAAGLTDTNLANNSATDTNQTGSGTADLSISKTNGTSSLLPGALTTYTVVVANTGPLAAGGAIVTDLVAAGLTKEGTPACTATTGGAVCPATVTIALLEGAGVVIPTFPAGGTVTFTIPARVTASSGSVTNTASVSPPAGVADPNTGNNAASDTDALPTLEPVSIPTLGEWMLLLLSLMLFGLASPYLRRR